MRETRDDPVRLIMAAPAVTVGRTATLLAAATVLRDEDIGAVAVVGPAGLDGVLSERDVVRSLADGAEPAATPVTAAMTADSLATDPESPIGAVLDLVVATGVRHVPVVAGAEVVGMVSMRDLLDVCAAR